MEALCFFTGGERPTASFLRRGILGEGTCLIELDESMLLFGGEEDRSLAFVKIRPEE